jgi:alkylation response protein AidB-like acyl-CoA dehydrogenase
MSGLDDYRLTARRWLDTHAPSYLRGAQSDVAGELAKARAWQSLKAANGYACITLPAEFGGGGGSELEKLVFTEEENRYDLPTSFFGVSLSMPVPMLVRYGSDAAKRALLLPAIRGEQIWCQLFSEPQAGSDLAALRLRAERVPGGWSLNGQKAWTTWAQYADWGVVLARTDPTVPKHAGLTYFYVSMKAPGVEVRRLRKLGGEQDINEVYFTDVVIPDSQRFGAVGQGFKLAIETLMIERYAIADEGGGGPSLERFIELAARSQINGAPALENGEIRSAIVDAWIQRAALREIQRAAMRKIALGGEPGPEGSIRKLLVGQMRQRLGALAGDLMGRAGLVAHDVSSRLDFTQSWLESPVLRIAGGTDDILRNTIAERVLGLPQDHRPDKGKPFSAG